MSDTAIVHPFGGDDQNNRVTNSQRTAQVEVETPAKPCVSLATFILALEKAACAKINASDLGYSGGSYEARNRRTVTRKCLRNDRQGRGEALARQLVTYAVYTSRDYGRRISSKKLGCLYNRDHTTILYGIQKIRDRLSDYPNGLEARLYRAILSDVEGLA